MRIEDIRKGGKEIGWEWERTDSRGRGIETWMGRMPAPQKTTMYNNRIEAASMYYYYYHHQMPTSSYSLS